MISFANNRDFALSNRLSHVMLNSICFLVCSYDPGILKDVLPAACYSSMYQPRPTWSSSGCNEAMLWPQLLDVDSSKCGRS